MTVNDYLARRDARWMGPVFHFLGMSVGVLQADEPGSASAWAICSILERPPPEERFNLLRRPAGPRRTRPTSPTARTASSASTTCEITWCAGSDEKAQRGHAFAIVDEVDNILIDEARTPLIISGENRNADRVVQPHGRVVRKLGQREVEINQREQMVTLTPGGEKHIAALLGSPLVDPHHPEEASLEQRHLIGHLEQALRARFLYQRDREYILQDDKVVIVDEYTGRMMPGRRWTDGLHQAVEAKEGLEVQSEFDHLCHHQPAELLPHVCQTLRA